MRVRERFERVLQEWVPEEDLRRAWREYLEHHGPAPDGPQAVQPVVFRGRSSVTGSIVEIRGRGDELRVEVDRSLVERVAAEKDFSAPEPVVRFRLNGNEYEEIFQAPDEALDALREWLDRGESPPWEHARELLADGLIDIYFDLTPRGRRALASSR